MKRDLICFLLFRDKEDEHQCTDEQQEWVEQIGDDLEGGNAVPQLCYSGETGEISQLEYIPGRENYSLPANSILCLHNAHNNNI